MDSKNNLITLSIESLDAAGAFTGAPVRKEIEWQQKGETLRAVVFVRPLSYRSAVADLTSVNEGRDAVAARIAACICDENGEAIFTREDITGEARPDRGPLDGNLTIALLSIIGEVTRLGKTPS